LKTYVGAAGLETDGGYGAKVMSEYYRLKEVAAGKQVSPFAITASVKPQIIAPKQADMPATAANSSDMTEPEQVKSVISEKTVSL
jgi:hypothetical protein